MTITNDDELNGILRAGRVVADVRDALLDALEPGITTAELDDIARELLAAAGALSAPEVTYEFPGVTCISVNEEAAHGVPGPRVIQAGDVVNVDVSAELDGFFADTGGTRVVPTASERDQRLCDATQQALDAALGVAKDGAFLSAMGRAIQNVARKNGFRVIKNLAGHGIGRGLHEPPDSLVSYFDPMDRRRMRKGQVLAVEPFLSTRTTWVNEADDGWTLVGTPGNRSAQFEHTVIITDGAPIIATLPRAA